MDLWHHLKEILHIKEYDKEKLHKIIFSWFHPLKNEWYPYLHNLKNWG